MSKPNDSERPQDEALGAFSIELTMKWQEKYALPVPRQREVAIFGPPPAGDVQNARFSHTRGWYSAKERPG